MKINSSTFRRFGAHAAIVVFSVGIVVSSASCARAQTVAPGTLSPLTEIDFSHLAPFATGYNAGGGPETGFPVSDWSTNLWNPGSKAESGIMAEPRTGMRAFYMTNKEGTPSVQLFTTEPLSLKPGQNYLASFIYMTDDGADGRFEVRPEGVDGGETKEDLSSIGIWKERVVPFKAPASGKIGFVFSTGSVDKKLYLREFKLKQGPQEWKPSPGSLPVPGAQVDEKKVENNLFVNPTSALAKDTNSGTEAAPLRTFAMALEKAKALIAQGVATRIVLAPGVYREGGWQLDGEKVGGKAVDTPLIIAGAEPGRVIFSGADTAGWEPKTWVLVDAAKKIYKHNWTHNWGPSDAMYYKPDNTLAQRREMLFVNGQRLSQKLIENVVYKPGGWTPKVDDEGMRGAGNWSNEGYLGPDVLQPGEFGVAELGPGETIQNFGYNGHNSPNTLFMRLPDGVNTIEGAQIEVSTRDKWLRVWNKNNLVFRNLTVRGFNPYDQGSVFEVEWFWSGRDNHDWLFENVSMSDNGGVAANISWVRALTLRNCQFSGNGSSAMSLIARDVRCEDTRFSNNGWRNVGHGLWFALQNASFVRCEANENNGFGFRNDHSGHYLTFENCQFNRNKREGGIFFEISQGPITLKNCDIRDNVGCGMRAISAQNVTLDGCNLINNEGTQVFIEADKRNTHLMFSMLTTNVPLEYPYMKNWTVKNSTFVAKGPEGSIFSKIWWGGVPQAYTDWFKNEFQGQNNRYWSPDNPKPFNIAQAWDRKDWTWADLKEWQQATGSDEGSSGSHRRRI
jgi:hypothetical protein